MKNDQPLWWKAESNELTASGVCGTWNAHSSGNHSVCWLIHLPDGHITFNQSDGDRTREKSKKEGEDASESKSKSMSKKKPKYLGVQRCVLVWRRKTRMHTHTHMCMHAHGAHTCAHSHSYSLIHVRVFPISFISMKAFPTAEWWGRWTDGQT